MLGATELRTDDRVLQLRSARQRRLLAALALRGGTAVSADRLAEALWGAAFPSDPPAALHSQIARLRAALGRRATVIETTAGGYRLSVEAVVDASEFEADLERARTAPDAIEQLARFETALALWRGPAFEDLDTDDARAEAARLTELRWAASEEFAAALLAAGHTSDAIALTADLCHREPLRERARVTAASALARAGRVGEALRLLDDFRRILAIELGIEPSEAVASLERAILAKEDATAHFGPFPRMTRAPFLVVPVFGRDNDVIAVERLLSQSRLVTLTGPGGVGKTTLALAVAHDIEVDDGDRAAYVDLARVDMADDVGAAFAAALGVERDAPGPWVVRLTEAIGRRALLVLVDNAEHVIDATASLVSELVRGVGGIRFLVTSREPLRVNGERVWDVEPLAITNETAIALFCDRAAAARPGWVLVDSARPTVVDICSRLDGLPLAIELAAGELRARTLDDVAARVGEPLSILERGDRSDPRHRTLRSAIDWSYESLSHEQRAVFRRLGEFTAGFSMTDAQRMCADLVADADAERIIVALVSRSLLRLHPSQSDSRYRMLDTIRAYALDRLGSEGEVDVARHRHAVAVTATARRAAEQLWGPDEAEVAVWFDLAQSDIVAAYRWLRDQGDADAALELAVGAHIFGWVHGRSTLRDLVSDAVSAIEPTGAKDELVALAYGAAASAAHTRGDTVEADRFLVIAFDHAARVDDASARLAHGVAADRALFTGATDAAVAHYLAAAAGFRDTGSPALGAYLGAAAGLAIAYGGDTDKARPVLAASLDAADESGCPSVRAFTRYATAELIVGDDPELARANLERAVDLARAAGATFVAGIAELSLATLLARTGDARGALTRYASVIALWRLAGNWTQQWNTLRTLVFVLVDLSQHAAAAQLMAAITAQGEQPTWGDDASSWASAMEAVRSHLEPAVVESAERATQDLERSDVLVVAEELVALATSI